MMKSLLYKEFRLAKHQTMYMFLFFGAMLLIPNYPYYVAFFYTCLAVFFVFLTGRENKDVYYTVCQPVRKRDIVRARCTMVAIFQLASLLLAVPFAVLSVRINPHAAGNMVGIEPNVAFFGLVLVMFALFNAIFFPIFYKDAVSVGRAFLWSSIALFLYIILAEALLYILPDAKAYLDTAEASAQLRQLPVLLAGMLVYALAMVVVYRRSAALFEKVDL